MCGVCVCACVNSFNLLNADGTVPFKLLYPILRFVNATITPYGEGIVPINELNWRKKLFNFSNFDSDDGSTRVQGVSGDFIIC